MQYMAWLFFKFKKINLTLRSLWFFENEKLLIFWKWTVKNIPNRQSRFSRIVKSAKSLHSTVQCPYTVCTYIERRNYAGTHGMMELQGENGTMVDIYLYNDPDMGYRLPVPR